VLRSILCAYPTCRAFRVLRPVFLCAYPTEPTHENTGAPLPAIAIASIYGTHECPTANNYKSEALSPIG